MWGKNKKGGLMITQVSSVEDLVRELRNAGVEHKERFLLNGGWPIIKSWVEQTYSSNNKPVLHEIFNLILEFPPSGIRNALLGKENPLLPVLAKIAEEVVRENGGSAEGPTAQLCLKVLKRWKKLINDIKEEKGRLKKGTKVHVTDETGRETTYQTLGEDFRWWLVTSPGGTQEVERTSEDYYQAVEAVVEEEKRKRRSSRIARRMCASPKKVEKNNRRPPPTPPIVRYTPSPSRSSSTEEVEEEENLEDKVEEETAKEDQKVREDEEKSPPQSPLLSPASVKLTRRRYPMRRRRQQESETDKIAEMTLEKAIKREKRLVKYRTPDLCKEEKPGGIFGKRRRVEVIGIKEMETSEENQDVRVENLAKRMIDVNTEKKPKSLGMIDKANVLKQKRNASGGGGISSRMEGIVKLMEVSQKPLYPTRKVATIFPSKKATKEEEARKKVQNEDKHENKMIVVPAIPRNAAREEASGNKMIVPAIPRNAAREWAIGNKMIVPAIPRNAAREEASKNKMIVPAIPRNAAREWASEKEDEDKLGNQLAVAVIPPRDPKENEIKLSRELNSGTATALMPHDPRLVARKKREDEARKKREDEARKKREDEAKKLIEVEDKQKNMVIAIYPLPSETKEPDIPIPPQLPPPAPPPVWKLRKIVLRPRRRRAGAQQRESKEKYIQQEREQFAFFADFSTDSPAEPENSKDRQPLPYEKAIPSIPSKAVRRTRVHANCKSGWPKVKDSVSVPAPVERIIAYSSQLFPPVPPPQSKESLPLALPQVLDSSKEEGKMPTITVLPTPTPAIQYVPIWYPVPVFPITASPSPPLPPLPATPPPPPSPPPPPPPIEEELPTVKTNDYFQKYRFIRIPELPKKAYIPALPPPVEAIPPPRESTTTPQPPPVEAIPPPRESTTTPQPPPVEAIPPPRENTPTPPPPGIDDQRPISPLGPQPIPIPLPVPAPTPQQLASIPETPQFPPSLLSLPLSPPAHHQLQHQPFYTSGSRSSLPPTRIPRSSRRKRRGPLLPHPDQPQHFINSPPTQFDHNFFNPSPPPRSNNHFFNASPPQQQYDNNPFNNPSPPLPHQHYDNNPFNNPSPPPPHQQFDNNPFNNPSPPPPHQQFDNNPFVNPPHSKFYYNLSGYQYPGPPPRFYRF